MSRVATLLLELEERMSHYNVPGIGIAVFREGQIEWRGGHGVLEAGSQRKIKVDSLFHACSISKMVTAIGILRLVQDGVLDLAEDVNRYLVSWQVPHNQYTEQKKVTLRSLLAHQAGFVDPEGSYDLYQEQDPFPSPIDLLTGKTRYNSEPVQAKYIPESQYSYSDVGYTVLEQIVEDVTGESFAAVMERLVLVPLGLKRTFFWNEFAGNKAHGAEMKVREGIAVGHDKFGCIVAGKRAHYPNLSGAGIWTTPTELASLTMEVIKALNGDTTSILRPDMAQMMVTGYGADKAIGLGVFLPNANGEPCLISQGWGVGFQCKLVAYPRLKSGIVVMTNSDPGKHQNEALVGEVLREICMKYEWPEV